MLLLLEIFLNYLLLTLIPLRNTYILKQEYNI